MKNDNNESSTRNALNDSDIEKLLKAVGRRNEPPAELTEEIRGNVRAVWKTEVQQQRRFLKLRPYAVAASILFLVSASFVTFNLLQQTEPASGFATISDIHGNLEAQAEDGTWQSPTSKSISQSTHFRTGDQYAAIDIDNGLNIRIDTNTEFELTSADVLNILTGRIYIDSPGSESILITTPFGEARDIGTQFQVNVQKSDWDIQVRDGQVAVSPKELTSMTINAGEVISIDYPESENQSPQIEQTQVTRYDASWHWTQHVRPAFSIDNIRLSRYLTWLEREVGKSIRYESDIVRRESNQTILRGSIDGLRPEDSLSVVLSTTDYRASEVIPGEILISHRH